METTDHHATPPGSPSDQPADGPAHAHRSTGHRSTAARGTARFIDVPGMRNLRDVGGFATADGGRVGLGLLYRSASLTELEPDGAAVLAALGLRTVVDLRSAEEVDHWPDRRHGLDFELVSLPTLPPFEPKAETAVTSGNPETAAGEIESEGSGDGEGSGEGDGSGPAPGLKVMYAFMADTAGPPIVACIRRLIAPGALPALVHCAVGKDRTGVTIAVLLSALGVDHGDISADYTLSNAGLGLDGPPVYYLDEHGVERRSRPVHDALLALFLERVHGRHGSTAEFLRQHGLTDEELTQLRKLLVVEAPAD
ncbi:tyrosine-protein phosphatase [Streptacidiphilus cavernicola]|uniref:Tyrosine-protein phosphatase n=1 Tax=Streptacidiphilus cavernicola TaxID=3342716 RepID=A0ABV6VTC5_9ACTN